jgi:hypothetical protein
MPLYRRHDQRNAPIQGHGGKHQRNAPIQGQGGKHQRNAPIQGQGGMTSATPRYKGKAIDKANRPDYQAIVAHIWGFAIFDVIYRKN